MNRREGVNGVRQTHFWENSKAGRRKNKCKGPWKKQVWDIWMGMRAVTLNQRFWCSFNKLEATERF